MQRSTGQRSTTPDRGTLRQGFGGLLKALWFLLALAIWALGYLLHFIGSMLIRLSGLAGGAQSLPQPEPISTRPPSPGSRPAPTSSTPAQPTSGGPTATRPGQIDGDPPQQS